MADYISQFTGPQIDARLAKVSQLKTSKQDKLVSGTNIKTINGQSVLGGGDITIQGGDPNAVKYTAQTLTDAQKAQARTNIAAASAAELGQIVTDLTGIEADIDSLEAAVAAINVGDYVTATTRPTASASTMGHIYLIGPDANNNYDRYFTQESGGAYSWVPLGSTQIDLSTYATKEEVTQLEHKVSGLMQAVYDALGPFAWWDDKPDINFNLNSVLVSLNLTNCTSSNNTFAVTLGDSYTTTISPYSGRVMTLVKCWMADEEVQVTNGVISIAEVTGPIVITAAAVNLDDEAYEGMSYRQLFETNNWLEISPGFENGSFSPMTIGAGTPVITTEEKDSGTYSLKVSSHTGDSQLSQQIRSASTSKKGGYCACRVKVTEYTQGKAGMQFVAADSVNVEGLCDWTTTAFHRTASSSDVRVFIGSFSNGTLTAYIDLPVTVLDDVFNTPPTVAEWTALYETYVAIKKLA